VINWSYLFAKLVGTIASWLDAGNLRNRVYKLEEEKELLWVALDDIRRMDSEGRLGEYAKQALDRIEGRE